MGGADPRIGVLPNTELVGGSSTVLVGGIQARLLSKDVGVWGGSSLPPEGLPPLMSGLQANIKLLKNKFK
jgi:hypothetical protein